MINLRVTAIIAAALLAAGCETTGFGGDLFGQRDSAVEDAAASELAAADAGDEDRLPELRPRPDAPSQTDENTRATQTDDEAAAPTAEAAGADEPRGVTPAEIFGLSEEDYRLAVMQTAASADIAILGECADRRVQPVRTDALAVADDVMAALAGGRGAVIRERNRVTGCGQAERLHNVFPYNHAESGEVRYETFAPGETFTSLKLQIDVIRGAVTPAARAFAQRDGCDAMTSAPWVVDTDVRGAPDGASQWTEEWTLFVCGARHELEIDFTPTVDGVSFNARIPAEG